MSYLKKPFQMGTLVLPNNVFYAPLAGCSDFPFRQMSAQYSPGLIYCEMVKMDPLVRKNENTMRLLDYSKEMHPIGAQICGSKKELAADSARIIEDLGFDVIDLNCGCPVDKVTKDGSGSGMLKTPELIGEILSEMVKAVKIPVTVKIRAGWDNASISASLITQIAEQAGASAIAIHGRTRQQAYKGPANWEWIKECKAVAKTILVIGNGDVMSPEAAEKMFETTGCDAVLVSRGTLGHPWIADDIIRYLSGEAPIERDSLSALKEHFEKMVVYLGERRASIEMRRVGCWYIKRAAKTKEFRMAISRADSTDEIRQIIAHVENCFV